MITAVLLSIALHIRSTSSPFSEDDSKLFVGHFFAQVRRMALLFQVATIEAPRLDSDSREPLSTGFGNHTTVVTGQEIWPDPLPVALIYDDRTRDVWFTLRGKFPFDESWRAPGL